VALPEFAIKLLLVGSDASFALLSAVAKSISSVKPKVLSARLHAVLDCNAREKLTQVLVPILYLQATQDRLIPMSSVDEILRIKPQTDVTAIDGPHLLFQRKPLQTAEVVARFAQQTH
jgi:pimeloyl-ACP methyl ester carboxylesterase